MGSEVPSGLRFPTRNFRHDEDYIVTSSSTIEETRTLININLTGGENMKNQFGLCSIFIIFVL